MIVASFENCLALLSDPMSGRALSFIHFNLIELYLIELYLIELYLFYFI